MTEEQSIKWDNDPHAEKRTPDQIDSAEDVAFQRMKDLGYVPLMPSLKDKFDAWLQTKK